MQIMTSFHKKADIIPKMIPRDKFWYSTVYEELLILIFQFLTNYVKDFTEGSPMNPPQPINIKKVQPLSG